MYTATVLLNITTFNPVGSGNITASIGAPVNTSPAAPNSSAVFSGDGQSITITRPAGYTGAVQLTYQLYTPNYLLAGIAVNTKSPTAGKGAKPTAGRQQFRTVLINRDQSGSQMIVTDALFDNANYAYLILVQSVATGQIGTIDPDIDNQGGE